MIDEVAMKLVPVAVPNIRLPIVLDRELNTFAKKLLEVVVAKVVVPVTFASPVTTMSVPVADPNSKLVNVAVIALNILAKKFVDVVVANVLVPEAFKAPKDTELVAPNPRLYRDVVALVISERLLVATNYPLSVAASTHPVALYT